MLERSRHNRYMIRNTNEWTRGSWQQGSSYLTGGRLHRCACYFRKSGSDALDFLTENRRFRSAASYSEVTAIPSPSRSIKNAHIRNQYLCTQDQYHTVAYVETCR